MKFTNSPLVSYTRISPNRTVNRNHVIDTITIHCVVGQCSVEVLGAVFAPVGRQASSNYGIGYDGKIAMYCEEKDRSWCTSSGANDHRAITIEVASDTTPPYRVNAKAYAALIDLCADICRRNGIKELKWKADKNLIGQVDKQNMTVHRWFDNRACPGEYLYNLHSQIAAEVNARLGMSNSTQEGNDMVGAALTFKSGDIVKITGKTYYGGRSVPSWVRAKNWIVHSAAGDRVVLDKSQDGENSIMSPFKADDVKIVTLSSNNISEPVGKPKPEPNIIGKGDVVSVAQNAKYRNGASVPTWVIEKKWIVREVSDSEYVVIDKSLDGNNAICSSINRNYLTVVSKDGTSAVTNEIKKGSKVRVRNGARAYGGEKLADFVYKTTYTVLDQPVGNRVIIGINGQITAAVNKNDLIVI